jgi:hypothetical protein
MKPFEIKEVGHWDAKLCTSCSEALQSGNSGVLYDSQQPRVRTPKTCPLCATEEFFCSNYQTSFDKVEFEFQNDDGDRTLKLFIYFGLNVKIQRLPMVPVRCK